MIIVQISDTHIEPDHPNGADRLRALTQVVVAINALDPQPDAVIHTGDMAHNGTPEKYNAAVGALKSLKAPLFAAAGNRDDRALIRENFPTGRDLMPGTPYLQYAVDDFPVRLIALDTLSGASNMGDYCAERAANLAQALAEETDKPCVLFMHHPPFEVRESKYRWQYDNDDAIPAIADAINGHAHVVGAFCGHAHRDTRGTVADVPASTVPSIAIDLRLGDMPEAAEAAPVFHLHRFSRDTGITTELCVAV